MQLDLKSVFLALALSLAAMSVGTWLSSRAHPDHLRRAAGFWAAACAIHSLGWTLIALRSVVGDSASVVGGNLCLVLSFSAYYYGICAIERSRPRAWVALWPLPVVMTVVFAFDVFSPDFRVRVMTIAAIGAAQSAVCAAKLLGRPGRHVARTFRLTGAGFAVASAVCALRFVAAFGLPRTAPPESLLVDVRSVDVFVFLWLFLAVYVFSFGFVLMCNEMLSADLTRLATTDPLTGRYNRRTAEQLGAAEEAKARRSGDALAVAIFDVDHFKRVNDTYGHPTGDAAIRHVADVGASVLRAGDVLARFGGEEFLVVMPGTTESAALAVTERLRDAIDRAPLSEGGRTIALTVSVGVAGASGADADFGGLVAAADAALYDAKRAGRNRVAAAASSLLPDRAQSASSIRK